MKNRIHTEAAKAHALLRESHELIVRLSGAGKKQKHLAGALRVRWEAMTAQWREIEERWPELHKTPKGMAGPPGGRQKAWRQFVQR